MTDVPRPSLPRHALRGAAAMAAPRSRSTRFGSADYLTFLSEIARVLRPARPATLATTSVTVKVPRLA